MVSFAYPSYGYNEAAIQVVKDHGYKFARAGFDRIYDPATDNRYIIPGFTATATNRQLIIDALQGAGHGKVAVLTFHGVPDIEHPWVNTPPDLFEEYLQLLRDGKYTVDRAARSRRLSGLTSDVFAVELENLFRSWNHLASIAP